MWVIFFLIVLLNRHNVFLYYFHRIRTSLFFFLLKPQNKSYSIRMVIKIAQIGKIALKNRKCPLKYAEIKKKIVY